MAKSYEVLHDTWLRGRRYASGSQAILGDDDAAGYIRACLIKGDLPAPQPEPEPEPAPAPEPVPEPKKKKK
jgi:hypothetical protein